MKKNQDKKRKTNDQTAMLIEGGAGGGKTEFAASIAKAGELFHSPAEIYEKSGVKVFCLNPWI